MSFLQQNRFKIATVLVIILGLGLVYLTYSVLNPLPETTTFKAGDFSFDYPRVYDAREYATDVVSIGKENGDAIDPYVDVVRYQSDPDVKLPASFDDFVKRQAGALCGADGPIESITCTQIGVTPYTNPQGLSGDKLDLTLVRKNLKTSTTTSSTYGPLYVFNVTASSTPEAPLRYSAIFIYPSLSAFVDLGTTSPALMDQIVRTFAIPDGVTN